jgi:stringent starvation protein B
MTRSSRPYLARALYEWLLDNDLTPYLVVDATQPGVEVPRESVRNGQIVLNASPTAVRDFFMENQAIGFSARFGGQPMQIMIPIEALLAVYASENGAGMVFGQEPDLTAAPDEQDASGEQGESATPQSEGAPARPALSSVSDTSEDANSGAESDKGGEKPSDTPDAGNKPKGKPNKKPTLRVIK